jgi:hypothetical protein
MLILSVTDPGDAAFAAHPIEHEMPDRRPLP